ncbi:MAG: methyltransferase domain-containing protein [Alphaproteobacteria bacterium]|nr:methyltransferase domain-containing protein [Alphaproteobacteria bacterium]
MTSIVYATNQPIISHDHNGVLDYEQNQQRLKSAKNLTLPLEEELILLKQLYEFDLGNFLFKNKGLNGYWTSYIILHAPQKKLDHPLENWIIHEAPTVKATQERFKIFNQQLQKNLKNNMCLASIPCGLMDDLLRLDFSNVENIKLIGIDLDDHSLTLARENADLLKKNVTTSFLKKDAWNLDIHEQYDVLTSNGLNIYEPDDQKVVALYKQFYNALKPNGLLIASFLTPPPALSKESSWRNVNAENAMKQKAIFADILQVQWQAFRTENQTRTQLEKTGFKGIEIMYDSQGMFPTIIARK